MDNLRYIWANLGDVVKLLGTAFGLEFPSSDYDLFQHARIDKKLTCWSTVPMNPTTRVIIGNGVIEATTLFYLSIWGGSTKGIKAVTAKIRNFMWAGTSQPSRARVAWSAMCQKRVDGGLNVVDPGEAMVAMMCKWILSACMPGISNFTSLIR